MNALFTKSKKGARVIVRGSLELPEVLLELPSGHSDWPIRYDDGRIAYDRTDVPGYAKKLVADAYKWLDSQWSQQDVIKTLENVLAGPISENQLHNLTRRVDGHGHRQLSMWITVVDGMCSVPNNLVQALGAYINARKA